jgi:hypothetical protein
MESSARSINAREISIETRERGSRDYADTPPAVSALDFSVTRYPYTGRAEIALPAGLRLRGGARDVLREVKEILGFRTPAPAGSNLFRKNRRFVQAS